MSIWYVRPLGGSYGAADGTTYATAYDGFAGMTWGGGGIVAGDTLYVCGTHAESLNVGARGTAGNIITITGDYPSDPGIIDGVARSIDETAGQYLTVRNITLKNGTTGFRSLYSSGFQNTHLIFDGVVCEDFTEAGIVLAPQSGAISPAVSYGVIARNCTATRCGGAGINFSGDFDGTVIDNCSVDGVITSAVLNQWGLYMTPLWDEVGVSNPLTTGWTAEGGNVYSRPVTAGFTAYNVSFVGATNNLYNQPLTQNTATPTTPAAGEWGFSAATVYVNIAEDPAPVGIGANVWVTQVKNCVIKNSTAKNCTNAADGVGIGFDGVTENCQVLSNHSYNNDRGFSAYRARYPAFIGNKATGNTEDGFRCNSVVGAQIVNNYIADNGGSGIQSSKNRIQTVTNNIITGNLEDYEDVLSSSVTEDYNCVYNNTTTSTTGSNNITTDPDVDVNGRPSATSDVYKAGTVHNLFYRPDNDGKKFDVPPSIGAYEYSSRSEVRK